MNACFIWYTNFGSDYLVLSKSMRLTDGQTEMRQHSQSHGKHSEMRASDPLLAGVGERMGKDRSRGGPGQSCAGR